MSFFQFELALWFLLALAMLVYTAIGIVEYALDLRDLYRNPAVTHDQREVAWSNLRNEIGRMLTAQMFLYFGSRALFVLPEWITHVQFFGVALYKLWCSVKDRRLRVMLLEEKRGGDDHVTGV
jgi:branched-subunit amino acid ABC-type transport system permease component